jgi:hypothetical protein
MSKKILIVTVITIAILIVGATTALAFGGAKGYDTLKDLTGMTDEQIAAERQEGARLGDIAKDKGVYDKFKDTMMDDKLEVLEARVKDGTLTQKEADEIEKNLENCDGTRQGAYIQGLRRSGRGNGCLGNGCGVANGETAPRGGFRGTGRNNK